MSRKVPFKTLHTFTSFLKVRNFLFSCCPVLKISTFTSFKFQRNTPSIISDTLWIHFFHQSDEKFTFQKRVLFIIMYLSFIFFWTIFPLSKENVFLRGQLSWSYRSVFFPKSFHFWSFFTQKWFTQTYLFQSVFWKNDLMSGKTMKFWQGKVTHKSKIEVFYKKSPKSFRKTETFPQKVHYTQKVPQSATRYGG